MFGRIAGRYDLANRLLSAGCDVRWRRRALRLLAPVDDLLDLACGTGDLAIDAVDLGIARRVIGADFCAPMLDAGRAKLGARPITFQVADALALPFADGSFDAAAVAFGWRNFDDQGASLAELARVLRPGGQLLILEFFRPTTLFTHLFHGVFGKLVLPAAGGLIAGDRAAYRYLHTSVQRFLSVSEAVALFERQGFPAARVQAHFGGVCHALYARRG